MVFFAVFAAFGVFGRCHPVIDHSSFIQLPKKKATPLQTHKHTNTRTPTQRTNNQTHKHTKTTNQQPNKHQHTTQRNSPTAKHKDTKTKKNEIRNSKSGNSKFVFCCLSLVVLVVWCFVFSYFSFFCSSVLLFFCCPDFRFQLFSVF